eukprot:CAMPEP_0180565058 /NCGR_PEP_ID=MMETSP1037_2-20121125/5341_1 /TAXON_ID=632150 /ORGANISM="Azadinium spinosum, Strain 3D9" /LENGTH=69 /DNA_ID=CAMNT_0022581999 /DNA_START=95 /DNA_END=300 /DNA_ORIENTATION=-
MERILKFFAVTGRSPSDVGRWTGSSPYFQDQHLCTGRKSNNPSDVEPNTCTDTTQNTPKHYNEWKKCTG